MAFAPNSKNWWVWAIGAFLLISVFQGTGDVRDWELPDWLDSDAVASQTGGEFDYSLDLSANDAGSINDDNENAQVLTITKTDLNSANTTNVSVTLSVTQTAGLYDTTAPFVVSYGAECYQGSNVDDSSDNTLYRTCAFSETDWYVIEFDGVSLDRVGQTASDAIDYDNVDTAILKVEVEDYTTLDKLAKQNYDEVTVARAKLSNGKTVTIKYVQTP